MSHIPPLTLKSQLKQSNQKKNQPILLLHWHICTTEIHRSFNQFGAAADGTAGIHKITKKDEVIQTLDFQLSHRGTLDWASWWRQTYFKPHGRLALFVLNSCPGGIAKMATES